MMNSTSAVRTLQIRAFLVGPTFFAIHKFLLILPKFLRSMDFFVDFTQIDLFFTTSCSTVSQYTFFFRYQKPGKSRPCSATQIWWCTTKVMLLHILSVTLPPPATTEAYQAFLFIPSLHGRCITLYLVMIWWPLRSDKNKLDQTWSDKIRQEQTCCDLNTFRFVLISEIAR